MDVSIKNNLIVKLYFTDNYIIINYIFLGIWNNFLIKYINKLLLIYQCNYILGSYEIKYISYNYNGMIKCIKNINNKNELNGVYIEYYDNGFIKYKCNYSYNKLNGKFTAYYNNSNIKIDAYYINNLLEGNFKYYNEQNKLIIDVFYKNNFQN